ncbi:MAG: hypothetical protein I3273_01300 [Candidatus Moeniiplasma glomeromycotorum]|nr:hypothetical protein [Candidatus Moeniiplasma glomeromycotorum]MCE8167242.1 hypothetical protein [Candidatus Moeniiplasma glomeromycotorum]MCE8168745.1 hypothetical protein [Candidatus Moeniiplasma glomeromycotorum]
MGKRSQFKPHPLKPDRVYGSTTVGKLINKFMRDGEKTKAEKIVYEAAKKVEALWNKEWTSIHKKAKEKTSPKKTKSKEPLPEENEIKSKELLEANAPPIFSQIWEEKALRNAEFDLEMVRGKPVRIGKDRFLKIFFCWLVEVVRGQKKGRKKNPKKTSEILAEEIIQLSNNSGKIIEKKMGVYRDARRAKGFAYSIPSPSTDKSRFNPKSTPSEEITTYLKELVSNSIKISLSADKFKPSEREGLKKELNHFSALELKEKLKTNNYQLIKQALQKRLSTSQLAAKLKEIDLLKEYKFEINSICSRRHQDGRVTIFRDEEELGLLSQPYNFIFTIFSNAEAGLKITATTLHNPILIEEK